MKDSLSPSELELLLMPWPLFSPTDIRISVFPITTDLNTQLPAATGPSPTGLGHLLLALCGWAMDKAIHTCNPHPTGASQVLLP